MATTVKNSRRRRFVTTMTAFLAISVMGVAFAAWVADGDGTGTATAGEAVSLDIDPVTPDDTLYPDNTADVTIEITNPNPYKVSVTEISLGADAFASDDEVNCPSTDADNIAWTGDYTIALDELVVGAGDGTQQVTLADAVEMTPAADNGCQDVQFTVDLDLVGESTAAGTGTPGTATN